MSCGDLPDAPIRPEGPAGGHGFTVAGVFADPDAATRAMAEPASAKGVDVVCLGPVLFLRRVGAEDVDETSWRPIADRLAALGARALVEAPAWEKSLSAGLLWRLDDEEAADELEEALTAYFAAPYFFVLRAPWAPPDVGTALTPAQQRARRHYLALTRHAERPDRAYVRRYLEAAQGRDPQALKELMEEQQRRHAERQRRVVESLNQEYPDLDPERVDRYLDHIDSPVPEIAAPGDAAYQRRVAEQIGEQYRRGAALGELMGQLADRWPETAGRPPEVVDPARAYSAWAPDVGREEGVFRLDTLVFDDVAVGLPALLDDPCRAGADLVLTLDDYDDVRWD